MEPFENKHEANARRPQAPAPEAPIQGEQRFLPAPRLLGRAAERCVSSFADAGHRRNCRGAKDLGKHPSE